MSAENIALLSASLPQDNSSIKDLEAVCGHAFMYEHAKKQLKASRTLAKHFRGHCEYKKALQYYN